MSGFILLQILKLMLPLFLPVRIYLLNQVLISFFLSLDSKYLFFNEQMMVLSNDFFASVKLFSFIQLISNYINRFFIEKDLYIPRINPAFPNVFIWAYKCLCMQKQDLLMFYWEFLCLWP